ncbi:MAG: riboflavin biosynthesis protein RibD [Hyphococcus sp.]|nr:MAG: riboflavin biosynthesis protein RibD [Marinicaulis sp.]
MGDARTARDERDNRFMDRAIALARNGAGNVAPNPMVGCVLVQRGNEIVGEGWHKAAGKPHAEIEAINAAGEQTRGSTAYVTLEPCNHQGRTGPCTQALIDAGVEEVIYAMDDPNPVASGGADHLRSANIKIRRGVREEQAVEMNRAWLHSLKHNRPYVIGKSAMSLDGRIATHTGESKWITSEESRQVGHMLRAESDAIAVGAGTVISDDPALTARLGENISAPLRIVFDSKGRTPLGAKVYERSSKGCLLATTDAAPHQRLRAFEEMGVETLILSRNDAGRPDLHELLDALHQRGVVTLMVEGGGELLGSFFDADMIDEMNLFVAPKLIGGGNPAFGGRGVDVLKDAERFEFQSVDHSGPDNWMRGIRRQEVNSCSLA